MQGGVLIGQAKKKLENMKALRTLSVRDNPVTKSPALDKLEEYGCHIYR